MSIQNIPEIIKAVGGDRKKRITLIVILVAMVLMAGIAKWTARGDCKPLIEQNQQLLEIQGRLTEQNQKILEKNREMSEGYLAIQEMLTQIKPDTVYVTVTNTPKVLSSYSISSSDTLLMSAPMTVPVSQPAATKKVRKTSHGTAALQQLKRFVDEKCSD
jgi:hypothetical protein